MQLPWPLTYLKVKFVAGRGTTIPRICLLTLIWTCQEPLHRFSNETFWPIIVYMSTISMFDYMEWVQKTNSSSNMDCICHHEFVWAMHSIRYMHTDTYMTPIIWSGGIKICPPIWGRGGHLCWRIGPKNSTFVGDASCKMSPKFIKQVAEEKLKIRLLIRDQGGHVVCKAIWPVLQKWTDIFNEWSSHSPLQGVLSYTYTFYKV